MSLFHCRISIIRIIIFFWKISVHPRDKLDVGYRLSRSGLAVAYDYQNVTYLGPIIANIVVASDSSKVNVTYSNVASPSIELRNPNGFEVCSLFLFDYNNKCICLLRFVVLAHKYVVPMMDHG